MKKIILFAAMTTSFVLSLPAMAECAPKYSAFPQNDCTMGSTRAISLEGECAKKDKYVKSKTSDVYGCQYSGKKVNYGTNISYYNDQKCTATVKKPELACSQKKNEKECKKFNHCGWWTKAWQF